MFNKLKEQGTKLLIDEISKNEGLKQKVDQLTNTVKAEADKLGLQEKVNMVTNTIKTVVDDYGVVEKGKKAIKIYRNIIFASKIVAGIGVLLAIVGIVNGSVGMVIFGALIAVPSIMALLKVITLEKQLMITPKPFLSAVDQAGKLHGKILK